MFAMRFRWRWQFYPYDHRRNSGTQGWLLYIGTPICLIVLGRHKRRNSTFYWRPDKNWLEFTWYSESREFSWYPRIPKWL